MNIQSQASTDAPLSRHQVTLTGLVRRYKPAVMLGALVLFLGLSFLVMSRSRPETNTSTIGVLMTMVGAACFLPVVLKGFGGPAEVVVYEGGLRWRDKAGQHEATWNSIHSVFRKEVLINQWVRETELRLELSDGRSVAFDHRFSDYDILAKEVQQIHARVWGGAKREELSRGEARFGSIVLRPASIVLDGDAIPWAELNDYTIVNGSLMFNTPGKIGENARTVALSQVPNYQILLSLLQEMGKFPQQPATFFQNN